MLMPDDVGALELERIKQRDERFNAKYGAS